MSIASLAFTGVSKFSSDLQTVLSRAVSIASLPIQGLQNDQTTLLSRKTALSSLGELVDGFASSLAALGELGDGQAMDASSNNGSVITAQVTGSAPAGVYYLSEVSQIAETAVAASTQVYATADNTDVSGAGNYLELVVNGETHVFNLTAGQDNLNGIRDLINESGAGVNASVINTGAGYALSVSGAETGEKTIELWTGAGRTGTNLLATVTAGADAEFVLNGQTITSSSNTIEDVIPGVSFTLHEETGVGETAAITVGSNSSSLVAALQDFASMYNTLRNGVEAQSVSADGVLAGNSVLIEVRRQMQSIVSLPGAGAIATLADLGLTFDQEGTLSVDASVIGAFDADQLAAAFAFVGASASGLGSLADSMSDLTDPLDGMIQLEQDSIDQADERLSERIATMTDRLDSMQRDLFQRLQAADALLSKFESQQSLIEASMASLTYMIYGKQE
jgi:flagellar hook-associated protein 2